LSVDPRVGTGHPPAFIALLGKGDAPTDALEDYCTWLKRALERQGQPMEILRVPWADRGWIRGITWVWREAQNWRGQWILLQYTALGWSRRGFPLGAVVTLRVAKFRGARCAIIFHDVFPYDGPRWIDRLRRRVQLWVMHRIYGLSEHSIMTVPVEKIGWLPASATKATFIPIAANLSGTLPIAERNTHDPNTPLTVAVFGITGNPHAQPEAELIAQTIRPAAEKLGKLRLLVMGRHADQAEAHLRTALEATNVTLEVHGVLPAEEIERRLSEADVLLFVRAGISSRRGSALAGVACGLPIVAFEGAETGPPVTEAGVVLAREGHRYALAANLTCVLSDDVLRANLRHSSLEARDKYFSWNVIARKFLRVLNNG
jgi:glycosyltransferase involved in cell wall biosynthesis